ncbi:hypothetical protein [Glutamicibacter sp.]|uniref:hypothetical protein n=1 Tax=Glutamicibacter sp. TaxID=1931995 RepID=UPI003D6AEC93
MRTTAGGSRITQLLSPPLPIWRNSSHSGGSVHTVHGVLIPGSLILQALAPQMHEHIQPDPPVTTSGGGEDVLQRVQRRSGKVAMVSVASGPQRAS